MSKIELTVDRVGCGSLKIDGVEIAAARSVKLSACVDDVTTAVVELTAPLIELEAHARVGIGAETVKALVAMGWKPPGESARVSAGCGVDDLVLTWGQGEFSHRVHPSVTTITVCADGTLVTKDHDGSLYINIADSGAGAKT